MVTRQTVAKGLAVVGALGLLGQVLEPGWGFGVEIVCVLLLLPYVYRIAPGLERAR